MERGERIERLKDCRKEIQEVLSKYPDIAIVWTCAEGSDTFGIYEDKVILADGYVSLDLEE